MRNSICQFVSLTFFNVNQIYQRVRFYNVGFEPKLPNFLIELFVKSYYVIHESKAIVLIWKNTPLGIV